MNDSCSNLIGSHQEEDQHRWRYRVELIYKYLSCKLHDISFNKESRFTVIQKPFTVPLRQQVDFIDTYSFKENQKCFAVSFWKGTNRFNVLLQLPSASMTMNYQNAQNEGFVSITCLSLGVIFRPDVKTVEFFQKSLRNYCNFRNQCWYNWK